MTSTLFAVTDRKVVLSMLWIFVVFNYLYADVVILIFRPGAYEAMAASISPAVALGATLLMEILLAMAFLARVLRDSVNRWANVVAGLLGTVFVAVTVGRHSPPVYMALASIEMLCTLFIMWYAWTWPRTAPGVPQGALRSSTGAA
jgi:hypothetical protein